MKRPAYSSERVARSDERRPASRSFVARIAWSSPRMVDSAPRTDESASPCSVSAARRSLARSARAFFLPSSSPRVARHAERPSGHSDGGTIGLPGACRRVPRAALRSHRLPRSAERGTIALPSVFHRTSGRSRCLSRPFARSSGASRRVPAPCRRGLGASRLVSGAAARTRCKGARPACTIAKVSARGRR